MCFFASLLVAAILARQSVAGSITATDMGPAAFLWPPDRVWSAALDNTPPCGSAAGAGNRTQYPLTGGKVALVDQTEGFDLQLAISFSQEPKSNDDFSTILIQKTRLAELDPGHTCVDIADPPSSIGAGSNATLQIIYMSAFDSPSNETFYACADITYVLSSIFTATGFCFNATEKPEPKTSASPSSAAATASPTAIPASTDSGSGSSGLSGGAIAGIVIGSVLGAAMIAAATFLLYRRRQQQRRQHMMAQSRARSVKFDEQQGSARPSNSQKSVQLRDL